MCRFCCFEVILWGLASLQPYTTDSYEITGGGPRRPGGPPPGAGRGSNLTDDQMVIVIVLSSLMAVFIVVSNSLVIFSILRPKNRDKLATPTNLLISQLSMADLLVGVLTLPTFVLGQKSGWPNDFHGCILIIVVSLMIPPAVSYFGCLFLSLERYLAIQHPFTWERLVNNRTTAIVSVLLWAYPTAFYLTLFAFNNGWNRMNICRYGLVVRYEMTVYGTHYLHRLLPLLAMCYMYTRIFLTARRHLLSVQPQQTATEQGSKKSGVSFTKQIRTAQKCFVIIAIIMICLVPQSIAGIIILYTGISSIAASMSTFVLMATNSAINPFLYARSNSKLKAEVMKLVFFWKNPSIFDRGESLEFNSSNSHDAWEDVLVFIHLFLFALAEKINTFSWFQYRYSIA